MKLTKNQVLALSAVLLLLLSAYFYDVGQGTSPYPSANMPTIVEDPVFEPEAVSSETAPAATDLPENNTAPEPPSPEPALAAVGEPSPSPDNTGESRAENPAAAPGFSPAQAEEQSAENAGFTCTLSVRCDSLLNQSEQLDPEKLELLPADGLIFYSEQVTVYEGENVFNILLREMKKNRLHLEYTSTPGYNSAYIEGISNLYEFDAGALSGWMYKVNQWFPNYGCSSYQVQDGDIVEWVYSCDLGRDVGGEYAYGKQI